MPKCLVPVGGRSILHWQLAALRAHGVEEFVIVRGYLGDVLASRVEDGDLGPGVRFVDNHEFDDNNILLSLFCAADEFTGPLIVSYSDIVFTKAVVDALIASSGDICLIIDRDFAAIYEGRTEHPLEEAEVADLDDAGNVRRVGKRALPADDAWGEFIGLAKFSSRGTRWLEEARRELCARYDGRESQRFQRAAEYRRAYLTDLIQHLIDAGRPITPVPIHGSWREIDTVQDLERASALLGSKPKEWK